MLSALAAWRLSWRPPAPVERAIGRWFDSGASGRALWVFLALFLAIWTGFQIISYASLDMHFDLVEAFAWSQHLSPGYKTHPPLSAIVVRIWFTVFPIADWAYHLLAMVNAAVGLLAIDLIARRYLSGDKRLVALLLLLLTPFYQFHGQRFNANAVLLSTWPIATYCFLRSFETRSAFWGAAAGVAAALAMLGKYYSSFLIAGFIIAALVHPRRLEYLRSPAPWTSALTGLTVLTPHLHWLLTSGAPTMGHALGAHAGASIGAILWKLVPYVLGGIGYVAVVLLAYALMVRPARRTLAVTLWPTNPDRRMLVVLLLVPLVLPAMMSPFLMVELTPLWTMSAWFLLPIVLLAPPEVEVSRLNAIRLAFAVLCIGLAVLIASPGIAVARFPKESESRYRGHYAAVAQQLTNEWRRATQRPLRLVTGEYDIANAVTFYSPDHPQAWQAGAPRHTPWITDERRRREGWAALCPAARADCLAQVEQATAGTPGLIRTEFEHSASFFGMRNAPVRFVFVLVPPQP